jgi:sec-independent protein translocase protein TatC
MRFHEDKEMELWEHLSELRSRIMRALLYVTVASVLCWIFYEEIMRLIQAPLDPVIAKHKIKFAFRHITEPFLMKFQISVISGLILSIPLLTLELWGFVAPGLTPQERKGFYFVAPLSLFFFFLGIGTAYVILPSAMDYFAGFLVGGAELLQSPMLYWSFVMKMILGFGVVFQLPVILMFLGFIGMVTSAMLKKNWRVALVLCSVIAAVVTPSPDAGTMMMMGAPLMILYVASIWLVALMERLRRKREAVATSPSYEAS